MNAFFWSFIGVWKCWSNYIFNMKHSSFIENVLRSTLSYPNETSKECIQFLNERSILNKAYKQCLSRICEGDVRDINIMSPSMIICLYDDACCLIIDIIVCQDQRENLPIIDNVSYLKKFWRLSKHTNTWWCTWQDQITSF